MNNKTISPIGLGCVTFGREINESASFAMMDYAYANNISFFDTAAAYGDGASETIIGKWLAKHRALAASITIATKVLPPYKPVEIRNSVANSLRRLGIDVIDILYLHRWDAAVENPEALAVLDELVKEGKVRMLGASNFTVDQLRDALQLQQKNGFEPFRFVQNNHNLAVSDISKEFRQLCTEHNISIVSYSPLGAGFLTGKHDHKAEKDSRFAIIPGHQDVYFNNAAYRRLKKLQQIATHTGHSPVHLALAWALHQPNITSVLVGGRTPAHLDQALQAKDHDEPALFAELTSG